MYINHYDKDNINRLIYEEFLNSVLPFDNPRLRMITALRRR